MKNIRVFHLKMFCFLEVEFTIYLNRHVFVTKGTLANSVEADQTPQNVASDQGLHCLH